MSTHEEWVASLKLKAEQEAETIPFAKTRYDICKQCEHFTALKFCNKCFCFVPAKVVIKWSICPIEKWLREKP